MGPALSRFLRALAGASVLALAACHQASLVETGGSAKADAPLGAHLPTAASLATEAFVDKALGADLYALQAAKMAEARARTPQVRAFARRLASDSAAGRVSLEQAVMRSAPSTPIPDAPTERQQAMLDLLRREPARTFDRTYVEQQSDAGQDTLGQLAAYAESGGAPGIRAAASALEPQVRAQVDQARALEDSLNTP